MHVITTAREMHQACRALKQDGLKKSGSLGFVPTMGALHYGHLSLVQRARADCHAVVASIFVNPTQFAAGEDFDIYPRTFEADRSMLEAAGVTLLFAPSPAEMYPAAASNGTAESAPTFVEVPGIGDRLDGASRPGHFRGVATIVTKLFNIVAPDRAYFGQKDAAQIAVLRAVVRDLNLPVELVACAIVREPDGLAMSSRNRNLSADERRRALILHRALEAAASLLHTGETSADTLRKAILSTFATDPTVRLDYAAVVDPATLLSVTDTAHGALIAVAASVGSTRLIDNLLIESTAQCTSKSAANFTAEAAHA